MYRALASRNGPARAIPAVIRGAGGDGAHAGAAQARDTIDACGVNTSQRWSSPPSAVRAQHPESRQQRPTRTTASRRPATPAASLAISIRRFDTATPPPSRRCWPMMPSSSARRPTSCTAAAPTPWSPRPKASRSPIGIACNPGLTAASSPTGTSAWFVNRIDIDRRHYTFSAVLTQVNEIWYVVAADLGAVGGSHTDALPPLPGGAANGTDVVVSLVREGAADPAKFLDQLDGGRDTVVLGPGRRDYARGAQSIERHWKHEKLAKHPLELQGEPRAASPPTAAWSGSPATRRPRANRRCASSGSTGARPATRRDGSWC